MVLLGGAMTMSPALRAQQKAMPVIGFLGATLPGPAAAFLAAFRQGLVETGFVEGENVATEYRWAEGRYDRLPALAAHLVGRGVDVIVASGTPPASDSVICTGNSHRHRPAAPTTVIRRPKAMPTARMVYAMV